MEKDTFITLTASGTGEYKDRGSKFLAFAYPITTESDVSPLIEHLTKEHPKSRHFCYAWRLGNDGNAFRANDDGEPSGTAGRPILGRIDSAGLQDVLVIVVRYFGGTLLGTSGLIEAYGESAAEALRNAPKQARTYTQRFSILFSYDFQPVLMQAVYKLSSLRIRSEDYHTNGGELQIEIRESQVAPTLLQLKASLLQMSESQASVTPWPIELTELGASHAPLIDFE